MKYFDETITKNKRLIDSTIKTESVKIIKSLTREFGKRYADVFEAYLDVLARGGKRIRGILAKRAYQAFGGKNAEVADEIAVIIELLHDYLLVIDDIEDISVLRRGKPSAHILLKDYHIKNQLAGRAEHYGESQAINAALAGQNMAFDKALRLQVNDSDKITALTYLNDYLFKTDMGQLGDFNNEAFKTVDEEDVMQVLRLKTAYYTYCMPVYFGASLAGGVIEPNLHDFLVNAGISFQIYDDIIGTFGETDEMGKSNMSDIKEGKRTLLVIYTLESASSKQRKILNDSLGNKDLTEDGFKKVQDVIRETGALDRCQEKLQERTGQAISSLKEVKNTPPELVGFLEDLADFVVDAAKI